MWPRWTKKKRVRESGARSRSPGRGGRKAAAAHTDLAKRGGGPPVGKRDSGPREAAESPGGEGRGKCGRESDRPRKGRENTAARPIVQPHTHTNGSSQIHPRTFILTDSSSQIHPHTHTHTHASSSLPLPPDPPPPVPAASPPSPPSPTPRDAQTRRPPLGPGSGARTSRRPLWHRRDPTASPPSLCFSPCWRLPLPSRRPMWGSWARGALASPPPPPP